ncbi:hypothetical protein FRC09_003802 [Ceratobasidium sp. 395]|nr:hypothetical protein FRC09_003802 [Ceratobasidium sp. 395]
MSDPRPQETQPATESLPTVLESLPFPPTPLSADNPPNSTERYPLLSVEQNNTNTVQNLREKKPLLEKPEDAPADHDVEYLKGISRGGRVWTTYVKETTQYDSELVDGWNRSLDVTLVFVCRLVFCNFNCVGWSQAMTVSRTDYANRFVLESVKTLQPDPSDRTIEILLDISRAVRGETVAMQNDDATESGFQPTTSAVWVNALWFLSLSLSVVVSLVTMLAKQWCYYFLYARTGDAIAQAEERQRRFDGLMRWKMQGILEHLPVIMHLSLGTTMIPVKVEFCPFKTPQSVYTRAGIDAFKAKTGTLLRFRFVQQAAPGFEEQHRKFLEKLKDWTTPLKTFISRSQETDPHELGNVTSIRFQSLKRLWRRVVSSAQDLFNLGVIKSHLHFTGQIHDQRVSVEPEAQPDANVPTGNAIEENQNRERDRDQHQENRAPLTWTEAPDWLT